MNAKRSPHGSVTALPAPGPNKRLIRKLRKDVLRTADELAGAAEEVKRIKAQLAPAVNLERWLRTMHHAAVLVLRREEGR